MKFGLKTVCLSFLCLFFVVNVCAQTTKEVLQTFTPNETIQSVKIISDKDSINVGIWQGTWSGDFILIYVKIKAKGDSPLNNYKVEYKQQGSAALIHIDPKLGEFFVDGRIEYAKVEYEVYIPDGLVSSD